MCIRDRAYNIEIGLLRDEATIAMNTSGPGLNRRGYRDLSAQAPLRETLGAALAMLSYYDGRETLVDPCCGSGTIVIEAAMLAARIAPGLQRTFAFDEMCIRDSCSAGSFRLATSPQAKLIYPLTPALFACR